MTGEAGTSRCGTCQLPMDPALDRAGLDRHPCCEIPPMIPAGVRRAPAPAPAAPWAEPAEACQAGWKCDPDPAAYPHGDYCLRHARMMAPASRWRALGVPLPPGAEPGHGGGQRGRGPAAAAKPEAG
jgi:hypothetical protein